MSTATITMPIDEYMQLKKLLDDKDAHVTRLNQELVSARTFDPALRVQRLADLVRAAIDIIGFAVANLSPEFIKRWPYSALKKFADGLSTMPDYSPHDTELALELVKFADECLAWEIKRKMYPEKEVPPPFPVENHPIVQMMIGGKPGATLESPGTRIETETTKSTNADS